MAEIKADRDEMDRIYNSGIVSRGGQAAQEIVSVLASPVCTGSAVV